MEAVKTRAVWIFVATWVVGCGTAPDAPRSKYHGKISAADGGQGSSCTIGVSMRISGQDWIQVNTLSAATGRMFEGTAQAITNEPVEMPLRLTFRCDGYAELTRELQLHVSPKEAAGLDIGNVVVSPLTATRE